MLQQISGKLEAEQIEHIAGKIELKCYIFCMAAVNLPGYHMPYETQAVDKGS